MADSTSIVFERQQYVRGQRLRSRDLRDQVAVEAEMRWWHNRALHNAVGVAEGLVASDDDEGVRVGAGIAHDCFGRELVLQTETVVAKPSPEESQMMVLLIRYPDGQTAGTHGGCMTRAPSTQSAQLVWKPARQADLRDGVPLASVGFDSGGQAGRVEPVLERAQPLARPHVASGRTLPDDWLALELGVNGIAPVDDEFVNYVALRVAVDFTAAGFEEVPCCFAWLRGPRLGRGEDGRIQILLLTHHIESVSAAGFAFVAYALVVNGGGPAARAFAESKQLSVCWLAIGPPPRLDRGCETRGANNGHS